MKKLVPLLGLALAAAPHSALACSVCMGDPNSNIARGANAAIFLMLGMLATVFAMIASFAVALYRRAKKPAPPHAQIGEALDAQPESGLR